MSLIRSEKQQFETRLVHYRDVRNGVIKCAVGVSSIVIEGICLPVDLPHNVGEPFFYGSGPQYGHFFNAPSLSNLRDNEGRPIDHYLDRKSSNKLIEFMDEDELFMAGSYFAAGTSRDQIESYFSIPLDKIRLDGLRRELVGEVLATAKEKLPVLLGKVEQISLSSRERRMGIDEVACNHLEGFPKWMVEAAANVGSYSAGHYIVERTKRPSRQPRVSYVPAGGMTDQMRDRWVSIKNAMARRLR